jgi:type I restriction enzyme S subunit
MSQPTLPKLWRWAKLNELAAIRAGTINPTNYASEMFELYSIPGFDNGRSPELLAGEQIRSSKNCRARRLPLFKAQSTHQQSVDCGAS